MNGVAYSRTSCECPRFCIVKTLDFSRYALSTCAAIILVAGCSGPSQFAPTAGTVANSRTRVSLVPYIHVDGKLKGETFSSSSVSTNCWSYKSGKKTINVSAKGAANGPYPGTFVLTVRVPKVGQLEETFKVRSAPIHFGGSSTNPHGGVAGTWQCKGHHSFRFAFMNLRYVARHSLGYTSLTYAKHTFTQTFH
jgi:hypothetical protein